MNEDHGLSGGKNEIRAARKVISLSLDPKSLTAQEILDAPLGLGTRSSDCLHIPPTLFFGQNVHSG